MLQYSKKDFSMKTFILLITFLLLTACTEPSQTIIDYPSETHKILAENKKHWEKLAIKDYNFVVRRSCYCPHEEKKQITVTSGTISEAKYIPSNTVLDTNTQQETIDGYFDIIQDALDKNAHRLTVTYDETYGFPSDIAIDYNEQIADEEIYYTLTHFHKGNGDIFCTKEYRPVCGNVTIQCVTTPCEAKEQTFSNSCLLNANPNATYLRDGEC